jgi:hypothetical protein
VSVDERDVHGPVLVFEGRSDLSVYPSIARAEGGTEVYDLHDLTYFLADGTLLVAEADGYQVRLRLSSNTRKPELRERLREYLAHPRVALDASLADDPMVAAQTILLADWERRPFRWFPWLDKRLNGPGPHVL